MNIISIGLWLRSVRVTVSDLQESSWIENWCEKIRFLKKPKNFRSPNFRVFNGDCNYLASYFNRYS